MESIEGRFLYENVLLALEIDNDFHKPGYISRGYLQINLTKAYNNLEWSFLIKILKDFELPETFIKWIWVCISTSSLSIAFNCELVYYFHGKKGLR